MGSGRASAVALAVDYVLIDRIPIGGLATRMSAKRSYIEGSARQVH
jgi:hypothetical protein